MVVCMSKKKTKQQNFVAKNIEKTIGLRAKIEKS